MFFKNGKYDRFSKVLPLYSLYFFPYRKLRSFEVRYLKAPFMSGEGRYDIV